MALEQTAMNVKAREKMGKRKRFIHCSVVFMPDLVGKGYQKSQFKCA